MKTIEKLEEHFDACEICGVVEEGAPHDKVKHLALPWGTMAYDQVIFEQE